MFGSRHCWLSKRRDDHVFPGECCGNLTMRVDIYLRGFDLLWDVKCTLLEAKEVIKIARHWRRFVLKATINCCTAFS
jgi:hypothetical protein